MSINESQKTGLFERLFTRCLKWRYIVQLQRSKKREKCLISAEIIFEYGVGNIQNIIGHLNLVRLVTSTSYNNFVEDIANNSVNIAQQSMIKGSITLLCIYTDNYDETYLEICKKSVEKNSSSWCNCR